ncbi:hypothetical protein MTP99_002306 [Tenebrio molitor]|nr:hypothetical protein MTP99_002306 [Tenebrio molitor]
MYKLGIFITFSLINKITCDKQAETVNLSLLPEYQNLMFLFGFLFFGCIIISILLRYEVAIPYNAFILFVGFLWGVLANNYTLVMAASSFRRISSEEILAVYVPAMVYSIAFCLDVHIFLKTLPQILIIAIPVAIFTTFAFGMMMKLLVDVTWASTMGLLFGLYCMPINPQRIVHFLRQDTTQTKHIAVLLEGEAVISLVIVDMVDNLILGHLYGLVVNWYQYLCLILRFIVIGLGVGYLLGLFGRYLLRKVYTDHLSVLVIIFALPFFTQAIAEVYLSACGAVSVLVVGIMMGMERTAQSKEVNKLLVYIWQVTGIILDIIMCFTAALVTVIDAMPHLPMNQYTTILVSYLLYYVLRFVGFLLFSPIISRLSYGIDFKSVLVCVWGGIKGPYTLELVAQLVTEGLIKNLSTAQIMFVQIVGLYLLSVVINGSITRIMLNILGLTDISTARQINMSNCMRHIFTKRERTIAILKMDRFLADTNWPMVIEVTNMRHPYKLELQSEEDDSFFLGYRFAHCSDCKKDFPQEPTQKEMKDMTREAKMRILKAKKMSYSRQYENGMMSQEAIRILSQAVELAMDTDEAVIELDGLQKRFTKESYINRLIRNRFQVLSKNRVSVWNIIDVIVIITTLGDIFYDITDLATKHHNSADDTVYKLRQTVDGLQLLRAIRLFRICEIFYPKLIRYLDTRVDSKMAFTYELGKSYAAGEAEILDMLPHMIDNKVIREEVKQKSEKDKVFVTNLLGLVQKEKPWIAITVKTKQAIRTILNSMREAIYQLRMAGWVDDYEEEKLTNELEELYKTVNGIKSVQPSAPKVIFKEVPWMSGDQPVIDFLFENVTVKKFEPGDVVFGEGQVADGIYIVVTGLFMITYEPEKNVIESLHEYGRLPIVDYLSSTQYEEPVVDYIVSGNCIGELSTLTGRSYNCVITAEAHSQVHLDTRVDSKMAFTYELGKSYAAGEAEILDMLPHMIDNKVIREEVKQKSEKDKVFVTNLLGLVQKEKPWIAITVKTKQAIRTILNSMREAIYQLRMAGWVDDYEEEKITNELEELYKTVNGIKSVQPSAPKVIFKEVAWMSGDQPVIDFLFENVTVKKFEPGDVVFGEGQVADGIYIVVTGLFMITYEPEKNVIESLHEYERLPIVDYLSSTQYEEPGRIRDLSLVISRRPWPLPT